jgi:hypothetical protein
MALLPLSCICPWLCRPPASCHGDLAFGGSAGVALVSFPALHSELPSLCKDSVLIKVPLSGRVTLCGGVAFLGIIAIFSIIAYLGTDALCGILANLLSRVNLPSLEKLPSSAKFLESSPSQ